MRLLREEEERLTCLIELEGGCVAAPCPPLDWFAFIKAFLLRSFFKACVSAWVAAPMQVVEWAAFGSF